MSSFPKLQLLQQSRITIEAFSSFVMTTCATEFPLDKFPRRVIGLSTHRMSESHANYGRRRQWDCGEIDGYPVPGSNVTWDRAYATLLR